MAAIRRFFTGKTCEAQKELKERLNSLSRVAEEATCAARESVKLSETVHTEARRDIHDVRGMTARMEAVSELRARHAAREALAHLRDTRGT